LFKSAKTDLLLYFARLTCKAEKQEKPYH